MKHSIAAIACALSSASATAYDNGNELISALDGQPTPNSRTYAMQYIKGVINGFNIGHLYATETKNPVMPVLYCIPSGVTVGQLADVVHRDLREKPAERHKGAGVLILNAISSAFPCKR